MTSFVSKTRSLLTGLLLALTMFAVTIPFSTAVPNKDVVLQVAVKKVVNATNANGNSNTLLETIRSTNQRYVVNQGEEIVLEVHLLNPSQQKIISAETWLSYDPKKLSGVKIDNTDSAFDLITPGENEFVPKQGLVRLGRGNTTGGVDATDIVVTAVHFKVLSNTVGDASDVKFYDFQTSELGHTNVNIISGGLPFNVLSSKTPAPVRLFFNSTDVPPVAGSSNNTGSSGSSGNGRNNPPASGTGSVYTDIGTPLPTPTGLKASTNSSSITLSWNPVNDRRVTSYYIYYTKHQNQYLHRKRVSASTYTFTNLQAGENYYFVVTAADAADRESGYSAELSVIVGQPNSINLSQQLSSAAIASLDKISNTAASGPTENLLLIALFSCLVYPGYKLLGFRH